MRPARSSIWYKGGVQPWLMSLLLALVLLVGVARGDEGADPLGRVLSLPPRPGPHWIWVSDLVLQRTALFDTDTGNMLGMLSAGMGIVAPVFAPDHREIYLAETYYSRGTRGERTDIVTVYDASSLAPIAEIPLPPKRADHASGVASNAITDDGRFLAVFNLTPATSISVVDLAARRLTAEIATPGCSLVYPAGPRRFLMLCGDGSLMSVTLDDAGQEKTKERSAPFFDPNADPVTEKAARAGNQWLFISFAGVLHPVDISGDVPSFAKAWSIVSEEDKRGSWRIGGTQQLAVHAPSGRLYALMHQGGKDTHKDPGTEVWVFDLATHERVQRIALKSPIAGFLRRQLGLTDGSLTARIASWLLYAVLPNPGVDRILVTQDEAPVLVTGTTFPSTLEVHDGRSGALLRDVAEVGVAGSVIAAP
ncbi:MAG TPA: amine dehydrogenase large subunit [Myxococcota bacterium]|nr:amine dehydrogenase large subunit [Myxococcota bacterium]